MRYRPKDVALLRDMRYDVFAQRSGLTKPLPACLGPRPSRAVLSPKHRRRVRADGLFRIVCSSPPGRMPPSRKQAAGGMVLIGGAGVGQRPVGRAVYRSAARARNDWHRWLGARSQLAPLDQRRVESLLGVETRHSRTSAFGQKRTFRQASFLGITRRPPNERLGGRTHVSATSYFRVRQVGMLPG